MNAHTIHDRGASPVEVQRNVEGLRDTPVDVLALWDREIDAFRKTEVMISVSVPERKQAYTDHLALLIDARAVVAELIDAAGELLAQFDGSERQAVVNLRAALARVQGGAK